MLRAADSFSDHHASFNRGLGIIGQHHVVLLCVVATGPGKRYHLRWGLPCSLQVELPMCLLPLREARLVAWRGGRGHCSGYRT